MISSTVWPSTITLSFFPAYCRNGVGIMTFTPIWQTPLFSQSWFSGRVAGNSQLFRQKFEAILRKQPPGHLPRGAVFHRQDKISIPEPGMLPVIFGGRR